MYQTKNSEEKNWIKVQYNIKILNQPWNKQHKKPINSKNVKSTATIPFYLPQALQLKVNFKFLQSAGRKDITVTVNMVIKWREMAGLKPLADMELTV